MVTKAGERGMMIQYSVAYLSTAAVFLIVDLFWLGIVARSYYRSQLGDLMADQINVAAAVVFYLAYVVGIVIFAVAPALASGNWKTALVMGGLFGLFAYATYDMTNLAVIKNWPLSITVIDIAWGSVLTAVSATLGFLITQRLVGS
jgi:uncharacterized membrane protein